jgi:hypothetical protein
VAPDVAQISKSAVSPNYIRPGVERNGVWDWSVVWDDSSAVFAATFCRLELLQIRDTAGKDACATGHSAAEHGIHAIVPIEWDVAVIPLKTAGNRKSARSNGGNHQKV